MEKVFERCKLLKFSNVMKPSKQDLEDPYVQQIIEYFRNNSKNSFVSSNLPEELKYFITNLKQTEVLYSKKDIYPKIINENYKKYLEQLFCLDHMISHEQYALFQYLAENIEVFKENHTSIYPFLARTLFRYFHLIQKSIFYFENETSSENSQKIEHNDSQDNNPHENTKGTESNPKENNNSSFKNDISSNENNSNSKTIPNNESQNEDNAKIDENNSNPKSINQENIAIEIEQKDIPSFVSILDEKYTAVMYRVSVPSFLIYSNSQIIEESLLFKFPTSQIDFENTILRKFDMGIFTEIMFVTTRLTHFQVAMNYILLLLKNFEKITHEEKLMIERFFDRVRTKYVNSFYLDLYPSDQNLLLIKFDKLLLNLSFCKEKNEEIFESNMKSISSGLWAIIEIIIKIPRIKEFIIKNKLFTESIIKFSVWNMINSNFFIVKEKEQKDCIIVRHVNKTKIFEFAEKFVPYIDDLSFFEHLDKNEENESSLKDSLNIVKGLVAVLDCNKSILEIILKANEIVKFYQNNENNEIYQKYQIIISIIYLVCELFRNYQDKEISFDSIQDFCNLQFLFNNFLFEKETNLITKFNLVARKSLFDALLRISIVSDEVYSGILKCLSDFYINTRMSICDEINIYFVKSITENESFFNNFNPNDYLENFINYANLLHKNLPKMKRFYFLLETLLDNPKLCNHFASSQVFLNFLYEKLSDDEIKVYILNLVKKMTKIINLYDSFICLTNCLLNRALMNEKLINQQIISYNVIIFSYLFVNSPQTVHICLQANLVNNLISYLHKIDSEEQLVEILSLLLTLSSSKQIDKIYGVDYQILNKISFSHSVIQILNKLIYGDEIESLATSILTFKNVEVLWMVHNYLKNHPKEHFVFFDYINKISNISFFNQLKISNSSFFNNCLQYICENANNISHIYLEIVSSIFVWNFPSKLFSPNIPKENQLNIFSKSFDKRALDFPKKYFSLNNNPEGLMIGPLTAFYQTLSISITFYVDEYINHDYTYHLMKDKNERFCLVLKNGTIIIENNHIILAKSITNIIIPQKWHRILISFNNKRVFVAIDGVKAFENNIILNVPFLNTSETGLVLKIGSNFTGLIGDIQILKANLYTDANILEMSSRKPAKNSPFSQSVIYFKPLIHNDPSIYDYLNQNTAVSFIGNSLVNHKIIFSQLMENDFVLLLFADLTINNHLIKILNLLINILMMENNESFILENKLFSKDLEYFKLFVQTLNENIKLFSRDSFMLTVKLFKLIKNNEKRKYFFTHFFLSIENWHSVSFDIYQILIYKIIPQLLNEEILINSMNSHHIFKVINTFPQNKSIHTKVQIYKILFSYIENSIQFHKNIKQELLSDLMNCDEENYIEICSIMLGLNTLYRFDNKTINSVFSELDQNILFMRILEIVDTKKLKFYIDDHCVLNLLSQIFEEDSLHSINIALIVSTLLIDNFNIFEIYETIIKMMRFEKNIKIELFLCWTVYLILKYSNNLDSLFKLLITYESSLIHKFIAFLVIICNHNNIEYDSIISELMKLLVDSHKYQELMKSILILYILPENKPFNVNNNEGGLSFFKIIQSLNHFGYDDFHEILFLKDSLIMNLVKLIPQFNRINFIPELGVILAMLHKNDEHSIINTIMKQCSINQTEFDYIKNVFNYFGEEFNLEVNVLNNECESQKINNTLSLNVDAIINQYVQSINILKEKIFEYSIKFEINNEISFEESDFISDQLKYKYNSFYSQLTNLKNEKDDHIERNFIIFGPNFLPIGNSNINPFTCLRKYEEEEEYKNRITLKYQGFEACYRIFIFPHYFVLGGMKIMRKNVKFIVIHQELEIEVFITNGLQFIIIFEDKVVLQKFIENFSILSFEYLNSISQNLTILETLIYLNFINGKSFNDPTQYPLLDKNVPITLDSIKEFEILVNINHDENKIERKEQLIKLNNWLNEEFHYSISNENNDYARNDVFSRGTIRCISVFSDTITFLYVNDRKMFYLDNKKNLIGSTIVLPPKVPQPTIQIFNRNSLLPSNALISLFSNPLCFVLNGTYIAVAFNEINSMLIYKIKMSKLSLLRKIKHSRKITEISGNKTDTIIYYLENSSEIYTVFINSIDDSLSENHFHLCVNYSIRNHLNSNFSNQIKKIVSNQNFIVAYDIKCNVYISTLFNNQVISSFKIESTPTNLLFSESNQIIALYNRNKIIVYSINGVKKNEYQAENGYLISQVLLMNNDTISLVYTNNIIECFDTKVENFRKIYSQKFTDKITLIAYNEKLNYISFVSNEKSINGIFFEK
ncbi:hypothetical protein TRFO_03771 [Tritrichomonas foetus]|uniref:BEACH domain-containing protein n=1 Tax=Tritrichomonas foetus TaxID=1144522 RepID=A0A1J4KLF2_9EUKA|nr:hypothetical protein TRFO_03771 [Tritrichomonas foetus]|eukprot:OHT12129.1 hypothetical protein TRFO_03771 [Tritrichomonas foetus]